MDVHIERKLTPEQKKARAQSIATNSGFMIKYRIAGALWDSFDKNDIYQEVVCAVYDVGFYDVGRNSNNPEIQEIQRFFHKPQEDWREIIDGYLESAKLEAEDGKRFSAEEYCTRAGLLALLSGDIEKVKESYALAAVYKKFDLTEFKEAPNLYMQFNPTTMFFNMQWNFENAFEESLKDYVTMAKNPEKAVEIVQKAIEKCKLNEEFLGEIGKLENSLEELAECNGITA